MKIVKNIWGTCNNPLICLYLFSHYQSDADTHQAEYETFTILSN